MGIKSFKNKMTEEINYGQITQQSLRLLPINLHELARIKLARLGAATALTDLRGLRGNRLEALTGDRQGQFSIRINARYRICFKWAGRDAYEVEIVDYH